MPSRPHPRLVTIPTVLVLLLACAGEPATAPGGPELARGGKPSTPGPQVDLANLTLTGTTIEIGGAGIEYSLDIINSTGKLTEVVLQGTIYQVDARGVINATRPAGGLGVFCGAKLNVLPHGTCPVTFTASTSNSLDGIGTLIPGPATLSLSLYSGATHLDYIEASVTLVAAP
jgi:hypothetical protein